MKHNLSSLDLARDGHELCASNTSTCLENVENCCTKRICAEETFSNDAGQTRLHLLCQESSCSEDEIRHVLAIFPTALQRRDVYGRSVSTSTKCAMTFHFLFQCVSYTMNITSIAATLLCAQVRLFLRDSYSAV